MNEEAYKRIQRARVQLTLDKRLVFFASLVLRLKVREDCSIPTACVNNVEMRYNPDFILSLPQEQVITLIAHETMHPALGHPWRLDGRDHELFNVAADYAINGILASEGLPALDGWLHDTKYNDMAAERIYAILQEESEDEKQQQQQQAQASAGECGEPVESDEGGGGGDASGTGDGNGGSGSRTGDNSDDTGGSDADSLRDALESNGTEAEWRGAMAEAANAARSAGTLSGSLARVVEQVVETRVNWRAELQQFMQQTAKADYTWYRPSTRYLPRGLFMPSLRSEQMPPIVIGVDTSGSVSSKELGAYAAEINAAIDAVSPEQVHVVYCDTKVQHVDTFEAGEQVTLHPNGGGGTRFSPVMKWVEGEGIQPAALIYFTDLWSRDFGEEPDYPVLWMSTDKRRTAPFGATIPMLEV